MTKEIFTMIAGLVVAFITANTVGLFDVLGHPANLFAVFFLIILALVAFAEDREADAARITTWLKRRDGPMLYTRTVQGLMRTLDRLLMPATAADQPMPRRGWFARWDWLTTPRARDEDDLRRLRQNPWSWPVYDAALKLAFLYPIFLAMAQWAWTGASTGLGALVLFPEEPRDWLRAALFCPLALAIIFRFVAAATSRRFYEIAAVSLAVFAVAFAGVGVGVAEVATVVTFAGSVAVAFAFAGTFVFASALAVASVVTVAVANAVAGAVAFAVAGAVAAIPGQFTRQARGGWGYALFTGVLMLALLAAALVAGFPADNPVPASVWLFLGVLPLVNAGFDWLSYGLTIRLIREGNRRKGLWTAVFWLIDAAFAVPAPLP